LGLLGFGLSFLIDVRAKAKDPRPKTKDQGSHMNTSYAKPDTLIGSALAPLDWTRSVSLVLAFSLLNALAAQIAIPIGPVPLTGQTFAVLLTGALLGSRLGAAALIAYLVEGATGLP